MVPKADAVFEAMGHEQLGSQVDASYAAALGAGGTDNGAPGLRRYHPNYYGAFARDPDGINIEAVCNAAEDAG